MFDEAFLAEQQAYYSARAPEYEEWWDRRGRYDHGPEENAAWFAERAQLYAALAALAPRGDVLELACGTGIWTSRLLDTADSVTAVDGSAEMLALNRARLDDPRVRYVRADLFTWEPERAYDAVAFGFWLSHVPLERLDGFLRRVRRALRPGGALFFADSRRDPATTSPDQPLAAPEQPWLTRRLNDGRGFRIVKIFHEPRFLEERLAAADLPLAVRETPRFFLYGAGRPPAGGDAD